MAFKFYNIVKANSRIEELELQLAEKEKDLVALAANPNSLEKEADALHTELIQAQADLATAKLSIGALETAAQAHAAQVAKLTNDLSAANAQLAAIPAQVETLAAAKSVTIVASQGVPPIAIKPAADPQTTTRPVPKGMSAQDRLKAELAARNPLGLTN